MEFGSQTPVALPLGLRALVLCQDRGRDLTVWAFPGVFFREDGLTGVFFREDGLKQSKVG